MRSAREYFSDCFAAERPRFVRVLKAVPPERADYRPHPRSMSAQQLVWLLARELRDACDLIEKGEATWVNQPAPSVPEAIAHYERNADEFQRRLADIDDARWDRPARYLADGKVVWEASLGDMLFGLLFDAIHHRGQLSTYLRPMGGKVPSIYGPSADDPGH